jgi:hypothetical protein
VDGDFTDADYRRRRGQLRQQLEAVEIPGESDILQAGNHLESLTDVWTGATQLERREMLRLMLQAVYVDVLEVCLVCIGPKPAFAPLFRQVAGLVEREGCFHPAKTKRTAVE